MRAFNANAALDMNKQVRYAAPKHAVAPPNTSKHAVKQPHLVPESRENIKANIAASKEATKRAAKIASVSVVLLMMFSALVFQRVQLLSLNSQVADLQQRIDDAESETVRLESEFNSLFSIDSIEKYAEEELGMVKRQKYQIRFFTNESKDEILLFDGKVQP